MSDNAPTLSAEAVLDFWFTECSEQDWFQKSDAFDATLRDRFAAAHAAACSGALDGWAETRTGRLALLLLLDQMSRNLHRGDARAFAQDDKALAVARRALAEGDHVEATRDQRLFLYLPFEHSENPADQDLCMALFSALGDERLTEFAARHKVIIDRFGRFPHRNAALGRESTPVEVVFLAQPNSSF
ncbi:MAG: DUF924 domain-containing protein [Thalassobaculaceae bacterium]|nr:DUF924 domain-containing protein [Thalassobaculaceae bacterium]